MSNSRRDATNDRSTQSQPRASARRYRGASNCRSFSLMNMLLKIKSILGGARGRFFRKARCTLLVYRSAP